MNFGKIFKANLDMLGDKFRPARTSIDVCTMVDGKPSNADIMDQMLEDEQPSPEVINQLIEAGVTMGFTQEQAQAYWG